MYGYPAPFGFSAIMYVIMWPFVVYNLYSSKAEREARQKSESQRNLELEVKKEKSE